MGFNNLIVGWTAIFPLTVLLYYFFRKRYEIKTISSTLFWEQSMRETKISPYLKNLQRNALFYLQMAALLLFVFILLDPYLNKEEATGGHTIFIVDTSASMLVGNAGAPLFEQHQEAMKKLAESRIGEPITIITTGSEPFIAVREDTDEATVRKAIDALTVAYEHEHMERALALAQLIVAEGSADIHIYTDSLDRALFSEEQGNLAWTIHGSKEEPSPNISIDKFGAVKTAEGTEAIVKVVNDSLGDQTGEVQITDAITEKVLVNESFTVESGKEVLLSFKQLPDSQAMSADIWVDDAYAADNTAYVLLGNEMSEAIVDGQLHELVKRAFEVTGLTVTTGSTNEMQLAQDRAIIVTNDVSFLEKGTKPVILIGRNDKSAESVSGMTSNTDDSLFTIADITDVYVSALYPPFASYTTIATVGEQPFIQKSKRGDIIILTDIELTDWPLHPSFPLFIWSASELLRSESGSLGTFIPNERRAVLSSGIENNMELYTLTDEYVSTFVDSSDFIAPSKPGIYKVMDNGTEKWLAVQLESAEKEIMPGTSYKIERMDHGEVVEEGKNRIGWYFLIPVLLLLLIEWEVQRRRGYTN
ncbi:BatA and WFA domain-containing protein [Sporosarcina sp. ACRSM]|uniref:vWA domain-containing protein n=1 Tax=Sporosarcina sp. ACRSM TaxID=2918216 RepID=UPI001EF4F437|nr:BatA and WFA domain-containing protein [Sporosarcina sp. ACRSM]MCG7334225.1 BatA and WFA domain-containing protein [Sporosarcina sp. ACRSM]